MSAGDALTTEMLCLQDQMWRSSTTFTLSIFRTDLVLSDLQLPLQVAHFLGMAEFLLIDGVELRAKQLGL